MCGDPCLRSEPRPQRSHRRSLAATYNHRGTPRSGSVKYPCVYRCVYVSGCWKRTPVSLPRHPDAPASVLWPPSLSGPLFRLFSCCVCGQGADLDRTATRLPFPPFAGGAPLTPQDAQAARSDPCECLHPYRSLAGRPGAFRTDLLSPPRDPRTAAEEPVGLRRVRPLAAAFSKPPLQPRPAPSAPCVARTWQRFCAPGRACPPSRGPGTAVAHRAGGGRASPPSATRRYRL